MSNLDPLEFDPNKFYLGRLCKRGHNWQETGRSLRAKYSRGYGDCVECAKVCAKANYEANKEEDNRRSKAWREANPDKVRASGKAYREANKDKIKAYREANKERKAEQWKQYHIANREERNAKQRAFNATEEGKRYNRNWQRRYLKTPQGKLYDRKAKFKRRARKKGVHNHQYSSAQVNELLTVFHQRCAYCESEERLTLDHFIPIFSGGPDCLGNLVIACHTCNSSKKNHDPREWFMKQPFFDQERWLKILKLLGKTEANYRQIPLF
uniref:HNH endonuclease n=1 Tax=Trichocoleus desertorum TaxID=1481672 RepID=UPI0025B50407|nr:HNH endonuclease [Trichocoleus desertorum]